MKQRLNRERAERNMLVAFGAGRIIEMQHVKRKDLPLIGEMMNNNYEWSKADYFNSLDESKTVLSERQLTHLCFVCNDTACPMCLVRHYG